MTTTALAACAVVVRYGATTALDAVDLELHGGEVHALVGENGAGKSTLLRVLAGVLRPHAGGVERQPGMTTAWVPQEIVLPLQLRVAEWVFLNRERRTRWHRLQRRAMIGETAQVLERTGCDALPEALIDTLAPARRKQVQLARALLERPGVLLLDEPTAVLGDADQQRLFACVRELCAQGTAVLYVTHRLDEVLQLADRVTVLRDGRHVSTDAARGLTAATLVRRMVGRDVPQRARAGARRGRVRLRVTNMSAAHVHGFSLAVREGEIVGLAGLMGAGRSEVLEAIAGVRRRHAGAIECAGAVGFVPEDRGAQGLVPALRVRENLFLRPARWRLRVRAERRAARQCLWQFGIRAPGTEAAVDALSGGNQQKLLLARSLRAAPPILLLDEPTAGVDVGAKAEIHALIEAQAAAGAAVIIASSELPELLRLCDRIVALRGGRAAGILAAPDASETRLAALITGAAA